MAREFTLEEFLRDLGLRIGAAAVVLGIFVGLGYAKRTDVLGLSSVLGGPGAFFAAAFLLIGVASVGWIAIRRH